MFILLYFKFSPSVPFFTLQEATAAQKGMADVPTCACPILEVIPVNVGGAFTTPTALSATHCLPAQLERSPASMAASVSAAASSVTAVWTVQQTGRMSWTVSFQSKTLSHEDVRSCDR